MDPLIRTEYFLSGGATTLIFIVDGVDAVSSFIMSSPVPWNMAVPTRHWRTKSEVSAIEIGPRTVHWNNRFCFGAETTNSAEVRRRCLHLIGPIFV